VTIRAFLFDFDGLILDTETASRAGWQWLYREHGHELPPELWNLMIGTVGAWDPWAHLEELVGEPLERETLNERRYAHELTLIEAEELRPGISDYLAAAERNGLKRAIVSSSSRRWVDMHLARLERAVGWDAMRHRRPRCRAGQAAADAVSRGARAARRLGRGGDRVRGLPKRRARREARGHLRRRDPQHGDAGARSRRDGRPRGELAGRPAARRAARALLLARK